MKYNTGNPVGSADPRDLYDTATVADNLVHGEGPAYTDRLGKSRKSWAGMEQDFADFLANSQYVGTGVDGTIEDYTAGIEVTAYNQVIRDGGEFWRAAAGTELPYTTIGAGMPEGGAFVSVGDANLRQELADQSGAGFGTDIVGHDGGTARDAINQRTIYVGDVSELNGITNPTDGEAAIVTGLTGIFVYDAGIGVWERKPEYYDNSTSGLSALNQQEAVDELQKEKLFKFSPTSFEQVTVGSGGDYSTINEALAYFSEKYPTYKSGGIYAEILLLSGFVVAEEVHLINGVDLGWVRISSEDAEVSITRSAITTPFSYYESVVNVPLSNDRRACFYALNNSILPQINTLFSMDASGAQNNVYGISCQWNSAVTVSQGCGVKNADRGIEVQVNSRGQLFNTVFSGSTEVGIRNGNNSQVHAQGADVSGSAIGVSMGNGSVSHFQNINASGCGVAINGDNARFRADGANCTNSTGNASARFSGACFGVIDGSDLSGAAGRGLYIMPDSAGVISAVDVVIGGAGTNAVENYSGKLNLAGAIITNATTRGIFCADKGTANAFEATVTGSGENDLVILRGSEIVITGGTTTSGSPSPADSNVGAFNAIQGNNGIVWN